MEEMGEEDVMGNEPYMDDTLETVTVTVNRREEDLQDYAGSATAFKQEELDRTGVRSINDVASAQPYADISNQEGNTEIYMRGVGSNNNTELGDPAVASHIDGIYLPRPRGIGSMLFDIERIELNRGPQGTLRGRNAAGGSVNIVSARPKLGEWDAMASVQFGNYWQRASRAMLNVPMGEKLALRLATYTEVHSPFYENAGPIHTLEAAESADTVAYRASLAYEPIDTLTVVLRHDWMHEGGTGVVGSNYFPALQAGLLPDEVPNPRRLWFRGPQGRQDMNHWGVSGDVTFDFGPANVGYLGGFRHLRFQQTNGGNAGIAFPGQPPVQLDNWSTAYWDQVSNSNVQELRFFSHNKDRLRWTVGGFFFDEDQSTHLGQTADQSSSYIGGEYTMPDMKSRSWAGFLDATYDIMENLHATGGVRYTVESKSRKGIGATYGFNGVSEPMRYGTEGFRYKGQADRTDFNFLPSDAVRPATGYPEFTDGIGQWGGRDTVQDALAAAADRDSGVSMWGAFMRQDGKYEDKFLDFRVGPSLDLTRDNMVYAMFSTGHKSGGFNDQLNVTGADGNPTGETIAKTYKPEALYAVEIGSKNEFMEKKMAANVSAFWYEYKDQQFQVIQATGPAVEQEDGGTNQPVSAVRYNAASSRILGLEADWSARLPAYFRAGLAGQFLLAKFTEGTVGDTRIAWEARDMVDVDLKGNYLTRSPLLTLNVSLGQAIPTSVGYFDWIINSQTKTKYYMTVFNGEGVDTEGNVNPNLSDDVPTYTRLDAGVGYTRPNGKLRIDAFVNNATDAVYMTSIINAPSLNLRFFNPPRQFGTRLTVNF